MASREKCIIIIILSALSSSCDRSAEYEQRGRTLDSLSGAINGLAARLQIQDTIQLQQHLNRFSYYTSFIESSRFDTLSKRSADQLQNFYHSGSGLKAFLVNRQSLLARIALLNSQYKRLGTDIRSRAISVE